MTFRLGLTGSIGMGKSTTARLFEQIGCDVWDADAAVHRLYAKDGAAVPQIRAHFPTVIINDAVDRGMLRSLIAEDPSSLNVIEAIVHPLVAQDREEFAKLAKAVISVFDIPLLFENDIDQDMDAVVVVTVPRDIQKARVLARQTMSAAEFELILQKQMPDREKRARADYVIVTDTLEHARAQVQNIVQDIKQGLGHA